VSTTSSSKKQFWPILCQVNNKFIFLIGIFYGNSKLSDLQSYVDKLLNDLEYFENEGFNSSNRHFDVKLEAYICDSPARSFLKYVIGHG